MEKMPDKFNYDSLIKRLDRLEAIVGIPVSDNQKPLVDTIIQLNKEILELRLKIENMDIKEKNYVID